MKNKISDKKEKNRQKSKNNPIPNRKGISFAWVVKNMVALIVALFLLNKFVISIQPGYNWAYNMLQKNLEYTRLYAQTTTDNRFEIKLAF